MLNATSFGGKPTTSLPGEAYLELILSRFTTSLKNVTKPRPYNLRIEHMGA